MTTAVGTPDSGSRRGATGAGAGYAAMWFGFLGAPAAWSVQELVSYMLVAHTCYPNTDPLTAPLSGAAWPAAVGVTAAMLLLSLGALAVAWRDTARLLGGQNNYALKSAESHRRTARVYLAFGGVLFGAIFTGLITYNLIALIFEPACRF